MQSTASLPPELWIPVFQHATNVPGTLVPDIYHHASLIGSLYTKLCTPPLREALVTKRALVRVCRQWWHLATPFLYQSVYIGRARHLSSLSTTLADSAAGRGTMIAVRPLGEYTQRLDIAIRDDPLAIGTKSEFLAGIIERMPNLAIFLPTYLPSPSVPVLDALQHSARSLRVLDWSSTSHLSTVFRVVDLLAECTQLRVLTCSHSFRFGGFERGGIPPTVTTLHLNARTTSGPFVPVNRYFLPRIDHCAPQRLTALQEVVLSLDSRYPHCKDLFRAYGSQLVSVHLYIPNGLPADIEAQMDLLIQTCPSLRRLTITSPSFSLIRRDLALPPIRYLGLRVTRQSTKQEFRALFAFLAELESRMPLLRVVQLLDKWSNGRLINTRFVVRTLESFMEGIPFRVEDEAGVLLTGLRWYARVIVVLLNRFLVGLDRLRALGHL